MNHIEAQTLAIEITNKRHLIYCPMIKECCTIACECFALPKILNIWDAQDLPELEKDSWYVQHGYCTCTALKGNREA